MQHERFPFQRLPLLFCLLCLCACSAAPEQGARLCSVVLEEGEGFTCADYTQSVSRGGDAVFYLNCADGYEIVGADYENAALAPGQGGGVLLTVPAVRYSTVVSLTVEKSDARLLYDPNDGSGRAPVPVPVTPSHLRWNTATDLFDREGHTQLGWNTRPDGSGTAVGLGSRAAPEEGTTLYAQWSRWSPSGLFRWEAGQDGAVITGYCGDEAVVTVPGELGGLPVHIVAAGAFQGAGCDTVILPDTVDTVEDGAFSDAALSTLYLFDNIRHIGNSAFSGCGNLATLHLNAAERPVYSGTYYDTFQDKFDRLLSLKSRRKIVLFSGSSTRFGFDCAALDAAFPDYEIVNMGVFAYTNALPQMELILPCMQPGDILLHCPEFDAAKRQFCTTTDLDEHFYSMMESNYDTLALLDLRRCTNVFGALERYLTIRDGMTKKSYALSPADFDEDGYPVDSPSYNAYGDYVVYRPNADSETPVYGLPVEYTAAAFPKERYIDPLNRMYDRFAQRGVRVYFSYAPRNALAVSEDSTPQARAGLDAYLRETLHAPVISALEDSLWSGVYLYGTDNHLSTEGASLHTRRIISLLGAQMEKDGSVGYDG